MIDPVSETPPLTPRQTEILEFASKGLTNAEIASLLNIATGTVKVHMAAIYRALDVTNRTEASVMLQTIRTDAPDERVRDLNAIAVLPFEVFNSDIEESAFADGLMEEVITRLSRWQWFPVIARQSCIAFKNTATDIRQVGDALGAAYVVEGSVRHSQDQVRVTAQLIRAQRNTHLWADTYDGSRDDIFAIQDDIARSIAAAIHPEIMRTETSRTHSTHPENIDAWQLAMAGLAHVESREEAACKKGLELANRALAADSNSLIAAYALAMGNYLQMASQWSDDPLVSASAVAEYAALCMRIAPDDPYSLIAEGTAHMIRGDIDRAIERLRVATERNPSSARALNFLGQLLGMQGEPDEGIACLEQAIALSPRDPAMFTMLASIGVCHFGANRLRQCCHYLHRAADLKNDEPLVWSIAAAAAALAGWQEEAELALAELLRVQPGFSLEGFRRVATSVLPAYMQRFEEGIRQAGFEEPR